MTGRRPPLRPAPQGQLTLDLPHTPSMGADDFVVSDCNQAAVDFINLWPAWPSCAGILAGPTGSGKSHLSAIWRERAGASVIAADQINAARVPELLASGALLVEDAHSGNLDETALFHALNWAGEHDGHILITTRSWPSEWRLALPDLISRLKAAPLIELHEPDNTLLNMVLVKLFADRQLQVEASLVDYLANRMERSLAEAVRLVELLDRSALAQKRRITRQLAAELLDSRHRPNNR